MPNKSASPVKSENRIDADQKDPFLARLDDELAKEDPKGSADLVRTQALATLICLHYKNPKSAFDGWNAMILAGRHGIPAPLWAIDLLEKAALDSIAGLTDLQVALGFRGKGKGQTRKSDVQRRLQAQLHDLLCTRVRKLIRLGKSSTAACRMVANHLKQTPDWNKSTYVLRAPNAETLLKRYRQWEKACGQGLALMDEGFDSLPSDGKDKFLRMFT